MTRLELQTAVVNNTRRDDKLEFIAQAINLALKEICQVEPFRNLRAEIEIPLNEGESSVQIPSTTSQIVQVRMLYPADEDTGDPSTSAGMMIDILAEAEFHRQYPNVNAASSGLPEACYVSASTIQFNVKANQAKILKVVADPFVAELSEDDDENPIPACDNAVIAWASARVFASLQLFQEAQWWKNEYMMALRIARDESRRKPGTIRQMRGAVGPKMRYVDPSINIYTRS